GVSYRSALPDLCSPLPPLHCTLELGSYIKDLSVVHGDLSSIVILDNSPGAYRSHPDNAIPIKSWFSDPSDTALLNLLPMLDALR
uniref:Mitochondrial import inner membrane translocase subunit TIM50 n=1 Tax=Meleagris gallopavo TaxID=9103 RepID=A0A803Y8U0_MELGA